MSAKFVTRLVFSHFSTERGNVQYVYFPKKWDSVVALVVAEASFGTSQFESQSQAKKPETVKAKQICQYKKVTVCISKRLVLSQPPPVKSYEANK